MTVSATTSPRAAATRRSARKAATDATETRRRTSERSARPASPLRGAATSAGTRSTTRRGCDPATRSLTRPPPESTTSHAAAAAARAASSHGARLATCRARPRPGPRRPRASVTPSATTTAAATTDSAPRTAALRTTLPSTDPSGVKSRTVSTASTKPSAAPSRAGRSASIAARARNNDRGSPPTSERRPSAARRRPVKTPAIRAAPSAISTQKPASRSTTGRRLELPAAAIRTASVSSLETLHPRGESVQPRAAASGVRPASWRFTSSNARAICFARPGVMDVVTIGNSKSLPRSAPKLCWASRYSSGVVTSTKLGGAGESGLTARMRPVKLNQYGLSRSVVSELVDGADGERELPEAGFRNAEGDPAGRAVGDRTREPHTATAPQEPVNVRGRARARHRHHDDRVGHVGDRRPRDLRHRPGRQHRPPHRRQPPPERDGGCTTTPVGRCDGGEAAAVGTERPVDHEPGGEGRQLRQLALQRLALGAGVHQRAGRRADRHEKRGRGDGEQPNAMPQQRKRRFDPERAWHRPDYAAARWTTG